MMRNYLEEIRSKGLFVSKHMDEINGKKIFLRIDTNSAVTDGKLDLNSYKLFAHSENLRKYVDEGALPIIVTHQGRRGDDEFVQNLEPIARKMEELSGVKIKYVNQITGERIRKSIRDLKPGEALMIKNIRDHPHETELEVLYPCHEKCTRCDRLNEMVKSPITQFYQSEINTFVNDGLSVCHRCQLSVVALSQLMPIYYGLTVESELKSLQGIIDSLISGEEVTFFVGGKKFEKIKYLEKILEYPGTRFFTGGLVGQYIAHADGLKINEKNRKLLEESEIEIAKTLLNKFRDKITYPVDFVLDDRSVVDREGLQSCNGIVMDIGQETLDVYSKSINKRCVFAGVMGVFERGFDNTLKLLRLAAGPNTVDLGGHSSAALFQNHGIFTYFTNRGGKVLTAGGAALALLAGERMPGLEAGLSKK